MTLTLRLAEVNQRGISRSTQKDDNIVYRQTGPYPSNAFFRAGGVEILKVEYPAGKTWNINYIQNQADWFYFSGHSWFDEKRKQYTYYLPDQPLYVSQIEKEKPWGRDLKRLIQDTCHLLDINDINGGLQKEKGRYGFINPGKHLFNSGVKEFILGYNFWGISTNYRVKNFTAEILKKYFNLYNNDKRIAYQPSYWIKSNIDCEDEFGGDRVADEDEHPFNACGIDIPNGIYSYYYKKDNWVYELPKTKWGPGH